MLAQSSITSTSLVENEMTDYTFTIITDSDGETWNFVDVYPVANSTSYPSFPGNSDPSDVSEIDVFVNDSPTEEVGFLRNLGGFIRFDHSSAYPTGTKITVVLKGMQNPAAATNLETKIVFNTASEVPITTYATTLNVTSDPPAQSSITSTSLVENEMTDYTFTIITDSDGETWNFVDVYPVANSTSYPSFPGNSDPSDVSEIDVFVNDSPTEEVGFLRNLGGFIRFDHSNTYPSGTKITVVLKGMQNPAASTNLETKIVFNTASGVPITTYSTSLNIDATLSINENGILKKAKLFPNPSSDFIKISGLSKTENYTIYNILGSEVSNDIILENTKVDIRNLINGIYFLKLNDGSTLKFIKR